FISPSFLNVGPTLLSLFINSEQYPHVTLESSTNREFEVPFFLKESERQTSRLAVDGPVKPIGIERKDQSKGTIDNRHHNLEPDARARPKSGIRAGQESDFLDLNFSFVVENFTRQLIFLENPGIADIKVRRRRKDTADDRDSIFQVENALCVSPHVDDIVVWPQHGVSRLGVDDREISHYKRNRTDRAEIKTSDIEVASHKETLVIRNSGA